MSKKDRLEVNLEDGLALLSDDSERYLGNSELVGRLVRGFVAQVFLKCDEIQSGADPEPIAESIEKSCEAMGNVFMGRDRSYVAQPWNSVHRLGILANHLVGPDPAHPDPGTRLFAWLAKQTMAAANMAASGQAEETVKAQFGPVVDGVIWRLLGHENGTPKG